VPFFSAYLRDISERRRAETAVKESEQRLKLVVDAIADGFWDFRLDGAGSFMSDRCATMLGYPAGTAPVVPPPDHPWVHPDDRDAVRTAWEEHLNGRTLRYECEHRRRHADGGWRWVLDRGKVVERDPQGRVLRVSGMQADTSDRRALEASLGSAERLESLGLLASGFAQELDALLSVIRAHASLASVVPDVGSNVIESLEVIQLSVSRAKSMAQSLLGLAPTESVSHAETVSGMEVVRRTMQLLRSTLPRTVEVVVEDLSGGRDTVRVDVAGLQQAIMNMLLRGCEVLAQAGRLTLRLSECDGAAGPCLQIACIDRAAPLSADAQARAFEALGADGALLGRTALGMAAVKRFAETAGGEVRAEVVGEANVITLELPLQLSEQSSRGARVVLWEDHPLLKPMLVEAFGAAGHRVAAIESETELLEALRRFGQGAVLVLDDRHWHGSLPQKIRELAQTPGAVSGVVVLVDRQPSEPSEPGIIWLRKPYALETLLATVTRVAADGTVAS
jgi:PAS domain S-box-containing protein